MILSWEKASKVLHPEEHAAKYASDTGVPGTYVPNMSEEDMKKYKAISCRGRCPRIEVRVTIAGTQVLAKFKSTLLVPDTANWYADVNSEIRKHGSKNVKISMNGPLDMTFEEWETFKQAMDEAIAEAKKLPA